VTNADRVRDPVPGPVGADEAASDYVSPEHLSATRWIALPQCCRGGLGRDSWQDVSVRPEGSRSGFTIEVATSEVLEADFEEGAGPHPRELLPHGEGFALSLGRMAVYLAHPFSGAEALGWTEVLMRCAGIPVASLEEVGRDAFYGGDG
jgi:hypothetical protein